MATAKKAKQPARVMIGLPKEYRQLIDEFKRRTGRSTTVEIILALKKHAVDCGIAVPREKGA